MMLDKLLKLKTESPNTYILCFKVMQITPVNLNETSSPSHQKVLVPIKIPLFLKNHGYNITHGQRGTVGQAVAIKHNLDCDSAK